MAQIGVQMNPIGPRILMEPLSAHMEPWGPQMTPFPCFWTSSQVSAPIGPCGFLLALWFPIGLVRYCGGLAVVSVSAHPYLPAVQCHQRASVL